MHRAPVVVCLFAAALVPFAVACGDASSTGPACTGAGETSAPAMASGAPLASIAASVRLAPLASAAASVRLAPLASADAPVHVSGSDPCAPATEHTQSVDLGSQGSNAVSPP